MNSSRIRSIKRHSMSTEGERYLSLHIFLIEQHGRGNIFIEKGRYFCIEQYELAKCIDWKELYLYSATFYIRYYSQSDSARLSLVINGCVHRKKVVLFPKSCISTNRVLFQKINKRKCIKRQYRLIQCQVLSLPLL